MFIALYRNQKDNQADGWRRDLLVQGLMLLFGFSQFEAQGTNLDVLIPPIGGGDP